MRNTVSQYLATCRERRKPCIASALTRRNDPSIGCQELVELIANTLGAGQLLIKGFKINLTFTLPSIGSTINNRVGSKQIDITLSTHAMQRH